MSIIKEMWEPIAIVLAIAAVFIAVMIRVCNQADWVSQSAKIEQLRSDAKRVDAKMAEDVAGQVTAINQEIASAQRWRKTIIGVFFPSGWDNVKFIDMPKVLE